MHQYILIGEIYSDGQRRFRAYVRMVVTVAWSLCRYHVGYWIRSALRCFFRWLFHDWFYDVLAPSVYFTQKGILVFKFHRDMWGYELLWRSLTTVRNWYYALLNVDSFWSMAKSMGHKHCQDPSTEELPHKPSVDIPPLDN